MNNEEFQIQDNINFFLSIVVLLVFFLLSFEVVTILTSKENQTKTDSLSTEKIVKTSLSNKKEISNEINATKDILSDEKNSQSKNQPHDIKDKIIVFLFITMSFLGLFAAGFMASGVGMMIALGGLIISLAFLTGILS